MFFLFSEEMQAEPFNFELRKFGTALKVANKLHATITVSSLSTFLYIAQEQQYIYDNKLSMQEIALRMGIPYTSLARQIKLLSGGVGDSSGLGLIDHGIEQSNSKIRILSISEKGKYFLKELDRVLSQSC